MSLLVALGYWMIAAGVVGLVLGPLLRRKPVSDFERWEAELPVKRGPYDWERES